jgi:hypothetical protein
MNNTVQQSSPHPCPDFSRDQSVCEEYFNEPLNHVQVCVGQPDLLIMVLSISHRHHRQFAGAARPREGLFDTHQPSSMFKSVTPDLSECETPLANGID